MYIGWFEFGRENGAPSWYGDEIQAPKLLDLQVVCVLLLFLIPTLAFFVVLPGARRLRCITTFTFLFSMAVGATITISILYPAWHTGWVRIHSTYKAFSDEQLYAALGVKVGLRHVNITFSSRIEELRHRAGSIHSQMNRSLLFRQDTDLDYNEKFDFDDVNAMELDRTLEKGLPFPILRVVEYLSADRTGFVWGRQYRLAGYYTSCILWLSLALWILQLVCLVAVPCKFPVATVSVGLSCLAAAAVYAINVPHTMVIHFPSLEPHDTHSNLLLGFSGCFYATLLAGLASLVFGSAIWGIQERTAHVFETFLSSYLDGIYQCKETGKVTTGGRQPAACPSSSCSLSFHSSSQAAIEFYAKKLRWKAAKMREHESFKLHAAAESSPPSGALSQIRAHAQQDNAHGQEVPKQEQLVHFSNRPSHAATSWESLTSAGNEGSPHERECSCLAAPAVAYDASSV